MDGLDIPSAVHNMDDIRIKSLCEVSLDAFEGCLSFEKSKIDYGLITKVLEELEWTSEVIIGCLGEAREDIRCRIRGQFINFMEAFSNVPGSIIKTANVLTWNLEQSMCRKSLDPTLEYADNWLSHIEDNVINQLEVDRASLLMNWELVEGLVNDVPEIA